MSSATTYHIQLNNNNKNTTKTHTHTRPDTAETVVSISCPGRLLAQRKYTYLVLFEPLEVGIVEVFNPDHDDDDDDGVAIVNLKSTELHR